MKTFYGDEFDRQLKMMRCYEIDKLKVRHQKRLNKLIIEVEIMKKILKSVHPEAAEKLRKLSYQKPINTLSY